jgi:DNA-binding PadR family transcriptional regulator
MKARIRRGTEPTADSYLPLTAVAFEILLVLADGERHGYAIMQEVERSSGRRTVLHPGTLYRAISRLVSSGLVGESDVRPVEDEDQRRRYYALTVLGRKVAAAEARRLATQVRAAQVKNLLPAAI